MDRSCNFGLVLYPDSTSYDCNLYIDSLKSISEKYCIIFHDKDKLSKLDQIEETNILLSGEVKKAHYHVFINFQYQRSVDSIKKKYPNCLVKTWSSWKACVLYAPHRSQPDKYQYSLDSIIHNMNLDEFNSYFSSEICSDVAVLQIIKHCRDFPHESTYDRCVWLIDNHLWGHYRQIQLTCKDIINEQLDLEYRSKKNKR